MSAAYSPNQAEKVKRIMKDTWGHLYPEDCAKYDGKIWISTGGDSMNILDRNFASLDGSEIEMTLVSSIMDKIKCDWGVVALYEVSCTLHFFKDFEDKYFEGESFGRIINIKVKTLHKLKS